MDCLFSTKFDAADHSEFPGFSHRRLGNTRYLGHLKNPIRIILPHKLFFLLLLAGVRFVTVLLFRYRAKCSSSKIIILGPYVPLGLCFFHILRLRSTVAPWMYVLTPFTVLGVYTARTNSYACPLRDGFVFPRPPE